MNNLIDRVNGKAVRLIGGLRGNLLEAFWFVKVKNAGDLVTPFLLKQYGFTPAHAWPPQARFIGCGSLLRYINEDYDGYVLGSGFLTSDQAHPLPKARILALRGTQSRDLVGAPASTPLGDPALLLSRFCPTDDLPKRYTLGVLPHYSDKADPRIHKLLQRYPAETHFIDIQSDPQKVFAEVAQCQYLISTTLHGCIFANALNIPVIWPTDKVRHQKRDFKFADYSSVYSKALTSSPFDGSEPLSALLKLASTMVMDEVAAVTETLDRAFLTLKQELLG